MSKRARCVLDLKHWTFKLTSASPRQSIGVGLEAEGITSHLSKGAKARVQDELAGRTGETDSEMSGAEST